MQNYDFNGMIVYCNCDNPQESAFWEYFHKNFARLGLNKLLSTYLGNPSFLTVYAGGDDNDVSCGVKTPLHENGDFRSEECLNLLEASDIVTSNPPFSLFRQYLSLLFQYNKKFIVLGNLNEAVCKDVFPHFRNNELWFGKSIHSGDRKFYVPDDYPLSAAGCGVDEKGKYIHVKGVRWYTNMDFPRPFLETSAVYDASIYLRYDDCPAINVPTVKDIPLDYDGVMGVPVTFLDKYNPKQFDIVAFRKNYDLVFTREMEEDFNKTFWNDRSKKELWKKSGRSLEPIDFFYPNATKGACGITRSFLNGKQTYARILIRRK